MSFNNNGWMPSAPYQYIGSVHHLREIEGLHEIEQRHLARQAEARFGQGYAQGHDDGWNAALDVANPRIAALINERNALAARLREQDAKLAALEARVTAQDAAIERRDVSLDKWVAFETQAKALVGELREANGRLQSRVNALTEQAELKAIEFHDLLWRHNQSLVFMNATQNTLRALMRASPNAQEKIQQCLKEHYLAEVGTQQANGLINNDGPHLDEPFRKAYPTSQSLLLDCLWPHTIRNWFPPKS